MKITKTQKKYIIQALFSAIQNEESLIDAYSNVHDGSEKQPVSQSKRWIRQWNKLLEQMDVKTKVQETKPFNIIELMQEYSSKGDLHG